MVKGLYATLGVSKNASAAEIKSAYRKLAKKHHPDLNKGDAANEKRFKEINNAYAILGDAEKRKQYDSGQINAEGQESPFAGFGGFGGGFGGGKRGNFYETRDQAADFNINEIFEEFLNKSPKKRKGATISFIVDLTFVEAALGVKKRLSKANGQKFDVNIQAGVTNGQTLRLKGQGEPGQGGGLSGDVMLELHVKNHTFFKREGLDILLDVPLTLSEAVLGGKITVPTLSGQLQVTVPAMVSPDKKLRLKGKGIAQKNGKVGDQYLILKVTLPKEADQDLLQFIEKWAPQNDYDVRKHLKK